MKTLSSDHVLYVCDPRPLRDYGQRTRACTIPEKVSVQVKVPFIVLVPVLVHVLQGPRIEQPCLLHPVSCRNEPNTLTLSLRAPVFLFSLL
jgi:hypothetical protein